MKLSTKLKRIVTAAVCTTNAEFYSTEERNKAWQDFVDILPVVQALETAHDKWEKAYQDLRLMND